MVLLISEGDGNHRKSCRNGALRAGYSSSCHTLAHSDQQTNEPQTKKTSHRQQSALAVETINILRIMCLKNSIKPKSGQNGICDKM
jgi:hypothetical protein